MLNICIFESQGCIRSETTEEPFDQKDQKQTFLEQLILLLIFYLDILSKGILLYIIDYIFFLNAKRADKCAN